jgi:hypothetical protein
MAEVNFVIRSQNAVAKINESQISVINSRFFPGISIPFSIRFPKITEQNQWDNLRKGRWNSFEGSLHFAGIDEAIFYFNKSVHRDIFENFEIHSDLLMELGAEKLSQIERIRSGDLELKLRGTVHIEIQKDYRNRMAALFTDQPGRENNEIDFFTSFEQFQIELSFKIAKSFWVETILSKIFKPFRLIQIPMVNSRMGKTSLEELLKAEEYFLSGDYDKVVAHCRVALDPIRKKFKSLQEWVKNGKTMEDWSDGIKFTTLQWLDYQFKLLADITNKSHHAEPRSFGHFSRSDAEAIYLVTAGVITMGEAADSPRISNESPAKNGKIKKE